MHATSKIPGSRATIPARVRDAMNFEALTPEKQRIVQMAFKGEKRESDIQFRVFLFSSIHPDDLPVSAWEKSDGGEHDLKIDQLATIIERCGYSPQKPVLLFAIPRDADHAEASVEGGHHRLQAVRDLAETGGISRAFKIPCIICFHFAEKIVADINETGMQGIIDELSRSGRRMVE